VVGERLELHLERDAPFELDVLLVSHLNQETFHSRQTLGDGLHDRGYDGLNFSTTRVRFGHLGWHSTRRWVLDPLPSEKGEVVTLFVLS
jgi:hypothetical protein